MSVGVGLGVVVTGNKKKLMTEKQLYVAANMY